MSTAKTDTQHDSIDDEFVDAFFTSADDDIAQPSPPTKPVATVVSQPTRNEVEPVAFRPRPKTYSPYRDTSHDEPSNWWTTVLSCVSVLCLAVAIGLFAKGYFASPNTTHTTPEPVRVSSSEPRVTTRNIEDCELGQRALGRNPLRDQVEMLPEPDPETSRKIVLQMQKESGHRLDIQLIRSLSWIESVGAIEHESFYLNMEEMGAVGDAYVDGILPCPPIEQGEGNVITGIFAHEADPDTRILSVTFSDGTFLKGVTDNHPFWSVDRENFVAIGDMKEGDWVKTASGLSQITKLDSRFARSGEMFYNLETHNEHVFHVTFAGILVHNTCTPRLQPYRDDVLVKGVHADILKNGRKVTEARLGVVDGQLQWFRWGDLVKNKTTLKEADKAIAKMLDDAPTMTAARDQVRHAIGELQSNLRHGTKNQKDFATRNLPAFQETLRLLDELLD